MVPKDTPILVWYVKWGRWGKRFYFHPECWVKDRVWHLGDTPKPIDSRGRPRITLTDEDRKSRKRLINQYNRLSKHVGSEYDLKLLEIEEKLVILGGIPKNWGVM